MRRAQLPLSLIEVALGAVLILGVALGFALGTPAPETSAPQLEAYAEDTATILANEPPRHDGATRLQEVVAGERAFDRERQTLERRVARILPENVLFHVETPHGSAGTPVPRRVTTGTATIPTGYGTVRDELRPTLTRLRTARIERGTVTSVAYNGSTATTWEDTTCPAGPDRQFGDCVADRGVVVQDRLGRTHVLAVAVGVTTTTERGETTVTVVVEPAGQ